MPQVLDVEQMVMLLELEPPFDKRDVQLARRRLAKQWHPDIAPPGRQHEHERHLKAINEAADQLSELAEESRGGRVSKNAVKVSAAAARKRRAEEGARAYAEEQRQRAQDADRAKHDPFASRVPDHSVVHRYARCLSYPEWGVGSVQGIYFTGDGDDIQQWARVSFQPGIRTVPAGSLQFVDFSKPDPGAERVQRFMTAAKHALAEGDFKLAARRLVFARDAEPSNTQVLRLMTLAFWQAGRLQRGRPLRARLDPGRARAPGAVPLRGADLRGHGRAVAGRRRGRARDGGGPERRLGLGAAGAAPAAGLRSRGRARGARARTRDRPVRAGAARPRARRAPARRRRRRGLGLRAGDAARARTPRSPGRATRTRWRGPTGSPTVSRRANGRWRWPTIPRCATSAIRSRGWAAQLRAT